MKILQRTPGAGAAREKSGGAGTLGSRILLTAKGQLDAVFICVASGEVEIGDSSGTLENASADTRREGSARENGRRGDAGEPWQLRKGAGTSGGPRIRGL